MVKMGGFWDTDTHYSIRVEDKLRWHKLTPEVSGSSIFTNDAFWRVSADTKTCGSPLYLSPTGGLCLPAG